jgi:hypothetical protein
MAVLAIKSINFFTSFHTFLQVLSWNLEVKKIAGIKMPANKIVFLIIKILDKSCSSKIQKIEYKSSIKVVYQKKKDAYFYASFNHS